MTPARLRATADKKLCGAGAAYWLEKPHLFVALSRRPYRKKYFGGPAPPTRRAVAAVRFEAVKTVGRALRQVGMLIAAPFIGLAFVVLFPLVGLAILAWMGGRAVLGADAPAKN